MKYTFRDKVINIPDKEIENLMNKLELSEQEAIDTWLEDNDYLEECAETAELERKALKNGTNLRENSGKAKNKPRTVKISDEKVQIFAFLKSNLAENYDISVLKENKMLEIELNGKKFKLDLIETRQKTAK